MLSAILILWKPLWGRGIYRLVYVLYYPPEVWSTLPPHDWLNTKEHLHWRGLQVTYWRNTQGNKQRLLINKKLYVNLFVWKIAYQYDTARRKKLQNEKSNNACEILKTHFIKISECLNGGKEKNRKMDATRLNKRSGNIYIKNK